VRAQLQGQQLPFKHVAVSGWVLDPERKKMGKSTGNALTPQHLIDAYGADGVRYWAAKAHLGVDTTFDEQQMKVGHRLAVKLLNASKFVVGLGGGDDAAISETLDKEMLTDLVDTLASASAHLDAFDHARALETIEQSFWNFCDNYLELVKVRAYGGLGGSGQASAQTALRTALSTYQRAFAPYIPFATEEAWSWWQQGSVHSQPWPQTLSVHVPTTGGGLAAATHALTAVRKAKSESQRKLRAPITSATIYDTPENLAALTSVLGDFRAAANINDLELRTATEFALDLVFARN
jgi:valyl-tRNA synthetase